MIREYSNQLKQYGIGDKLKEGYYVDAKDENQWKVGQIKRRYHFATRTTIEVRLDGYSTRDNIHIDLPGTTTLAPFRLHSLPYTGPKFADIRREDPARDINTHSKLLNGAEAMKPQEVNQYVRGELFILVDHLLTKRKGEYPRLDFQEINNFLHTYVAMGFKFLNKSCEFLKQLQKETFMDPQLMYVHPRVAILFACTEILFNFNSIISPHEKRVILFSCQTEGGEAIKSFRAVFEKENIIPICNRILSFKGAGNRGLPWSLKKEAYVLLHSLDPSYKLPEELEPNEIIEVLDYIKYLESKSFFERDEAQTKHVKFMFNLITSHNFQGRLKGLSEIRKEIEYKIYHFGYQQRDDSKTDKILKELLSRNIIATLIDNHSFNSEIFKRSIPIFQFLERNGALKEEHLDTIIQLHKGKNQIDLKILYGSLAEFGRFLNEKNVKLFFNKIMNLPIDEQLINLVKDYTLMVIEKHPVFKKINMKENMGFGVDCLWKLINSKEQFSPAVHSKIIENFASLLTNSYYAPEVQNFIIKSIKGIEQGHNFDAYLKVIHESAKISKGHKINRAIEIAEKEINIIEAVMRVIRSDKMTAPSTYENLFEFLGQVNPITKHPLQFSHLQHLWGIPDCRLFLLKFLRRYRIRESNEAKSVQRVTEKEISQSMVLELIDKIFTNPAKIDFQLVNQELFQTCDELIIFSNSRKNVFQYNYKHTIRLKNPDKLHGLDFYIHCINFADNSVIVQKSLKRLIEFYLRPDSTSPKAILDRKVKYWDMAVDRISKLKRHRLLGFEIFFEEIEGRMKSLNILEPDPNTIVVMLETSGRMEKVTVPRYTSLWKLRAIIGELFQLGKTNFTLKFSLKRASDFELEEDFSTAYIDKREDGGPQVIVTPSLSKETLHPHHQAIKCYHQHFSDKWAEQLFLLLSSKDPMESQKILSILNKVPFLKKLYKKVEKFDISNWNEILDLKEPFKLEYELKIVQECMSQKWMQQFIEKNGIEHLANILMTLSESRNYKLLGTCTRFMIDLLEYARKSKSATKLPFNDNFIQKIIKLPKALEVRKDSHQYLCHFLISIFSLLKELSATNLRVQVIFDHAQIRTILQVILFSKIESNIHSNIYEICQARNCMHTLYKYLDSFLKEDVLKQEYRCKPLFELIKLLIVKDKVGPIINSLIKLFKHVRKQETAQESSEQTSQLLLGYLECIKLLMANDINSLSEIMNEDHKSFIKYLIRPGLFNEINPSKINFKSSQVRRIAFEILEKEGKKTQASEYLRQTIVPLMQKGTWRSQTDWSICPTKFTKQKFRGLKNLAATCYINSLLQQLFFIEEFRENILSSEVESVKDKENILAEIQKIFGFMKYSQNAVLSTLSFCQTFIMDGQPIDPRIQTDVDEFFHSLMDKLERNLNELGQKDIINNIFTGQFSNLIIGQECPHTSERVEHFLSLRLEIKDKANVAQALDEFIKAETLQGDNAYFCERCDKKVKAQKRVCLKTLPKILILTLKRFEFNFDTMEKFKLNSFCSFPQNINMYPYSRDGLREDKEPVNEQNYEYVLKGIVIHYGISEAGHYTSYLRNQEKKWFYFDDDKVYDFDLKDLEAQCFGGIEENYYGDDVDKKKNAYVLFYEQVKKVNGVNKKMVSSQIAEQKQAKVKGIVDEENMKIKVINTLFEPNLMQYAFNIAKENPKLFLIYYHLVFLRSRNRRPKFMEQYKRCIEILKVEPIAQWYLAQINESFIMQFLIFGEPECKYAVMGLVLEAVQKIVDLEFIQQCTAFLVLKKYTLPLVKVFPAAKKASAHYDKELGRLNLPELVRNKATKKEQKEKEVTSFSKYLRTNQTDFGYCMGKFVAGKDQFDNLDLYQALAGSKLTITTQELDYFMVNVRRRETQRAIATIVVRKNREMQAFKVFMLQFLRPKLLGLQAKTVEEESIFNFVLVIFQEFLKIKDKDTETRVNFLAAVYIQALQESLTGYKCEKVLLNKLFSICLNDQGFKNAISNTFMDKDNKTVLKSIKQWIKQTSNASTNIRNGRWSLWRTSRTYNFSQSSLDKAGKVNQNKYFQYLNAIVEKHLLKRPEEEQAYIQDHMGRKYFKIIERNEMFCEVESDGKRHFIPTDDLEIADL